MFIIDLIIIAASLCLTYMLIQTKRALSAAKATIQSREAAIDAANGVIAELASQNAELAKEIEEQRESMLLHGSSLEYALDESIQFKEQLAFYFSPSQKVVEQGFQPPLGQGEVGEQSEPGGVAAIAAIQKNSFPSRAYAAFA